MLQWRIIILSFVIFLPFIRISNALDISSIVDIPVDRINSTFSLEILSRYGTLLISPDGILIKSSFKSIRNSKDSLSNADAKKPIPISSA